MVSCIDSGGRLHWTVTLTSVGEEARSVRPVSSLLVLLKSDQSVDGGKVERIIEVYGGLYQFHTKGFVILY